MTGFETTGVTELGTRGDLPPIDMDFDMRSALDRLVEDVAGGVDTWHSRRLPETPYESMTASLAEDSMATEERAGATLRPCATPASIPLERAVTDPLVFAGQPNSPPPCKAASRSASVPSIPPPPPPKDAIRAREELVLEKRRQARQQEEEESQAYYTPPKIGGRRVPARLAAVGRPSRRRSMSTGDLERLNDAANNNRDTLLNVAPFTAEEDPLADSIDRELKKLRRNPTRKMVSAPSNYESVGVVSDRHAKLFQKYAVRQHEELIYASSNADKVSHMDGAGDLDTGKA